MCVAVMNLIDYQSFLNELISTLEADPVVWGLIALGSTADATYRDEWSDHDFWIITAPGAQSHYLDTYVWLPRTHDILMTVRHGVSYRTVLYRNQHEVEYAVFDPNEAVGGKIDRYQVLIDRHDISSLAESIKLQTHQQRTSGLVKSDLLEHFCSLLWTAYVRWARGEHLSSQRYIQFAADTLLDLFQAHDGFKKSRAADQLDPRRRLEQREPELGQELLRIGGLVPPEAGIAMIDLAERKLMARTPELAWEKVSVVKAWLQSAG